MKFQIAKPQKPAVDYDEVRAYIDHDGDLRVHPDYLHTEDNDSLWFSPRGYIILDSHVAWTPREQTDVTKLFFRGDVITFVLT